MSERRKNLYYLNELSDYKVSSHDPDVRGWQVKDADNRVIGKVDNLLVNKEKKKVVYLDVEVDESIIDANHDPYGKPASSEVHEFINKDGENHLIIPVGLTDINRDQKFVYTDRIDHRTFAETKRMPPGRDIDRDYEIIVLESYNRRLEDDERPRSDRNLERDRNPDRERDLDRDPDLDRDRDRDRGAAGARLRDEDQGAYHEKRDRRALDDEDDFYDRREFDDSRYRSNR